MTSKEGCGFASGLHSAHITLDLCSFIIGDEAAFHMNGTVSTQNVRFYTMQGQPPD